MGKTTGFMEIERQDRDYLPVEQRTTNYREFMVRGRHERRYRLRLRPRG